jgi:hypothetical protein
MSAWKQLIEWLKTSIDSTRVTPESSNANMPNINNPENNDQAQSLIPRYEAYLYVLGCILTFGAASATLQTSSLWIFLISLGIDCAFLTYIFRKHRHFRIQFAAARDNRSFYIFMLLLLMIGTTAALILFASWYKIPLYF